MNTKALVTLLVASSLASAGNAQLILQLNPAGLTGFAGDTLTYNATLTNTGSSDIFLNGIGLSGLPAQFGWDGGTLFNANWPLDLGAGDQFVADLFQVTIDPSMLAGDYFGTVDIFGGVDGSSSDTVAQSNFEVTVKPSPTPEPLTIGLGFAGAGLAVRRRFTASK